jgi:hypothetical protein
VNAVGIARDVTSVKKKHGTITQSFIQRRSGMSWTRTQSISPPDKIHIHSP